VSTTTLSGGRSTVRCGQRDLTEYVIGFGLRAEFVGGGLFGLDGQLLGIVARCGDRVLDWGEGLLHGTVAPSSDRGPVIVSWQSPYTRLGGGDSVMVEEQREMIPSSDGTFDVCGIPRDATVSVRRKNDASSLVTSRFAPGALATRVSVR